MIKKIAFAPVTWGCILLIVAQIVTLAIAGREKIFVVVNNFPSPQAGIQYPIIYFFASVIVIGIILFLFRSLSCALY